MGIDRAVSDTGPLIHLSEVSCFHCLEIVEKIYIPEAVASEVKSKDVPGKSELDKSSWIATVELNKGEKQKADKIASDSGIEANDAETIVLARMWDIKYLFTDDKATRRVAELYGLEPHGTPGIVARAYREEILTYRQVLMSCQMLF